MKKRIILTALSIVCMLTSCTPITYDLPEVSFDSTTFEATVAGFRINMSARIAKQVAEEQEYRIDSKYSDVTFDDIAEAGSVEIVVGPRIYLKRSNEAFVLSRESVALDFNYGKVEGIWHEYPYCPRQEAEDLLELFLTKYPQLTPKEERGDFRSYIYEPNRLASMYASIRFISEERCRVSISVSDRNYSQSRHNQELYEKIETVRRRY